MRIFYQGVIQTKIKLHYLIQNSEAVQKIKKILLLHAVHFVLFAKKFRAFKALESARELVMGYIEERLLSSCAHN
jgi:hypothetical protein